MQKSYASSLIHSILIFSLLVLVTACSSTPKISIKVASQAEAEKWLSRYCAKLHPQSELLGNLVMKANTQEFKGQYPASLHFDQGGAFQLEVTNIIGGTLVQLKGNDQALAITVPSKPKYSRTGITHYLGLELSVLAELLHGDLPCPTVEAGNKIGVEGARIVMETANWKWIFERGGVDEREVPVHVRLIPQAKGASIKDQIEMSIEGWDVDASYAKKVTVHSPEGELKWTWRTREIK